MAMAMSMRMFSVLQGYSRVAAKNPNINSVQRTDRFVRQRHDEITKNQKISSTSGPQKLAYKTISGMHKVITDNMARWY